MAPETKQRGSATLTRMASGSMMGLISIGLVYYLVRVFTFTEHLNHLYTMATSGMVGTVVVVGVMAWIFTVGFLFWTQEQIFQGITTFSLIALWFLPWWALRPSALTTPYQMMNELVFQKLDPAFLFPWGCLVGHFLDFFLTGTTGWSTSRGLLQWVHVVAYLAAITLPWMIPKSPSSSIF
jgi:hypothetical protein